MSHPQASQMAYWPGVAALVENVVPAVVIGAIEEHNELGQPVQDPTDSRAKAGQTGTHFRKTRKTRERTGKTRKP